MEKGTDAGTDAYIGPFGVVPTEARNGLTITGQQGPTLASETDYAYDALGRLATVTAVEQNGVMLATPQTTTYENDLEGNLIEEDLPNGVVDQFTYNTMNRLTEETENGPGSTPIAEYDYTYRADGLKATASEDFWFANNGQQVEVTNNISYTYDALNRLIDEAFVTNADAILGLDSGLPSDVRQWESFNDQYTYDLDSNQVEKSIELAGHQTPDETIASSYDVNDRILQQVDTTASGSTTTNFSYNNTEQTSQSVYSGTSIALGTIQSSQDYQYDLQGRTSGVTITNYTNGTASRVEQLTYGYDDSGIRVSALDQLSNTANGTWNAQTLTEYLNDPNNLTAYSQVVRETQSDPTTGQVQQVVEYTIGPLQISQTTTAYTNGQPGTPSTLAFGYDGHGSVRVLLNTAGAIATVAGVRQLFNYDAYGNAIGFEIALVATTLLYSGQQTDVATGLQYLRARYYDPNTATFTSLDSYGGNTMSPLSYNKYLYAQGDPITYDDPSGRDVDLAALDLDAAFDPEAWLPPPGAARYVGTGPTLSEYYKRLKGIEDEYHAKWPELYAAMGLDKFFTKLIDVAKAQVASIVYDPINTFYGIPRPWPQTLPDATYDLVINQLKITVPIDKVWKLTLVHETVHAWDDQQNWYLNWTYLGNIRKAEALGYASEYILERYDALVTLHLHLTRGTLSKSEVDSYWTRFWAPFLHNKTRDKHVWVLGKDAGMLTNDDLADFKAKVGLGVDYDKIAPLFPGLARP
jgi:RHS repeat-associated protein